MSTARALRRLYRSPHGPETAASAAHAATPLHALVRRQGWCNALDARQVDIVGWAVLVAGFGSAGTLVAVGPSKAVILCGFSAVVLFALVRRWLARSAMAATLSLPLLCESVSRSMRSGATMKRALDEACDAVPIGVANELRQVLAKANRGVTLSDALADWAAGAGSSETRIVAAALTLAADNEAASARALDGAAQTLRDRQALAAEIGALTAQTMASMSVLVGLPVAFLAVDAFVGGRALTFLLGDPRGQLCLSAGIGLDLVGWLWMRRLVASRIHQ